jgi:hypothetical protein
MTIIQRRIVQYEKLVDRLYSSAGVSRSVEAKLPGKIENEDVDIDYGDSTRYPPDAVQKIMKEQIALHTKDGVVNWYNVPPPPFLFADLGMEVPESKSNEIYSLWGLDE